MLQATRSLLSCRLPLVIGALGLVVFGQVNAATYYIDPDAGDDGLNGLVGVANGSSGPWRSLARASTALRAGDLVLLRCGGTWRETWQLNQSGTATAPINIGVYPARCRDKPAIDGGLTIPAHAWERHAGNVWRAKLPFTEFAGGDLGASAVGWQLVRVGRSSGSMATVASCPGTTGPCTAISSGQTGATVFSGPRFTARAGQTYLIRYQVRASAQAQVGAAMRSDRIPSALHASYVRAPGSGSWQTMEVRIRANSTVPDARLEFELPAGQTVHLRQARVEQVLESPLQVFDMVDAQGQVMAAAHHPNDGHDASRPETVFLRAGVSNYVLGADGRYGSTYVATGADLALPTGATITPGLGVWIRSQNFNVYRHEVTSVTGNRVFISPQSVFPLIYSGWGYFFTGALWMLDSPGEWFYDSKAQTAYAWMPDGGAPGDRVALSTLQRGIQIGSPETGFFPSRIAINGLAVRRVAEGVNARRTADITLRSLELSDIAGIGLQAEGAAKLTIDSSVIRNTASDAISIYGGPDATVSNNTIRNSGVRLDAQGKLLTLPRENYNAVQTGVRGRVTGNDIQFAALNGITIDSNSVVSGNSVSHFAQLLNDGGGIYTNDVSNVQIRNNLVVNGKGNLDGTPVGLVTTLVNAIYLDHYGNGFTIDGNTVGFTDYCVILHGSYSNQLSNNTCYGARRSALRLQETSAARRAAGDIWGNQIRSNQWFQTEPGPAVLLESTFTTVDDFGTFNGNAYANLYSPVVAQESGPGSVRSFTLREWQSVGNATGRQTDQTGVVAAPTRGFALGTLGASVVATKAATDDWSGYGTGNPAPALTKVGGCAPGGGACVRLATGGSPALLIGPRFPLVQDQMYRVSFDAMVSDASQLLTVQVERAGPTYESLMGLDPYMLSGSTAWRRYSFTFRALASASAARITFYNLGAGRQVSLGNFEVVPVNSASGTPYSTLLTNADRTPKAVACPLAATRPLECSKMRTFPDGSPVSWPLTLAPVSGRILFTLDTSLPDSDGDGVADLQDACTGTTAGQEVNARGCSIGQ